MILDYLFYISIPVDITDKEKDRLLHSGIAVTFIGGTWDGQTKVFKKSIFWSRDIWKVPCPADDSIFKLPLADQPIEYEMKIDIYKIDHETATAHLVE